MYKYDIQRATSHWGVQYWVKRDFQNRDESGMLELEKEIEQQWVEEQRWDCYLQQKEKDTLKRQASYYVGTSYEQAAKNAYTNSKLSACDDLKRLGVSTKRSGYSF